MMKILRALAFFLPLAALPACSQGQQVNTTQAVTLAGLRAANGRGSFPAAAYGSDGSLFVLYDQGDGVRVLKLNSAATTVLAQAQIGAAGDSALALAVDPSGSVYVTGTSTSGVLAGTSGTAFRNAADTSTNSFVAKFDSSLATKFITFLGAGRTAVASIAATADAVFVTGITFNGAFPVTPAGVQQTPAAGTSENGFVERFSADGSTLVYATYLTGVNGSTVPAAVVADSADNAYVAGYTSSTGYPTTAALVARSVDAGSGFLTRLTAVGDGFSFSTFIPGAGVTGLALDAANGTLLLTGNIAGGEFPLSATAAPLGPATYVSLLRVPLDGQSVSSSVVLVPGTQAMVAAGQNGSAWVTGVSGTPLFPGTSQPLALVGDSFAVHVTSGNALDQTLRLGGQAVGSFTYGMLGSAPGAPAVSSDGSVVTFPATLTATIAAGRASTQRFDLPLVAAQNAALPNSLRDLAGACTASGQCNVTAGYLTQVNTTSATPALSISSDASPNILIRNLGSATANGLSLSASGFTLQSNCGTSLPPSGECSVALSGSGPGTLTVSAANAPAAAMTLPANALPADPLAVLPVELDFGIQTAVNTAVTRTFTVTNLSSASQVFSSALDGSATSLPYTFSEAASTCAGAGAGMKSLTAGSSCTITLGLTVSANSSNDGPVRAAWKVGTHDVALTALGQAAAVNVTPGTVDFGTQFVRGIALPRFVFLSNNSSHAVAHATVQLPSGSPFTVSDECPSTLEPHTVCRLALTYASATAPSADAVAVALDDGVTLAVTGRTLPQQGVTASTPNPNVTVTPASLTFASPVAATGVSSQTQTVTVTNTGSSAVPLTIAVAGDFILQNGCPASLAGGASCTIIVSFAPSQPGSRQGLISVSSGSGFAPAYVSLSGTGSALLPANNGTIDIGQTLVGEPVVRWIKVQTSSPSLTATTSDPAFGVALVEDVGYGHGSLPQSAFARTATGTCRNCYLGVQFLSQTAGTHVATLSLSTVNGGKAEVLTLTAIALPVSGLLLSPVAHDFGPVSINSSSAPQVFTLTNLLASGAVATINSAATSGDFSLVANNSGGQACNGTLAFGASCFLAVAFTPTLLEVRSGVLTVTTDSGNATASLAGFGLSDPGVAFNPVELDFNNAAGTAATQQTVAVSNTGSMPETIGPVTSSSGNFVANSACGTLAPGAMCSIAVTFAPGTSTSSGTLLIPVTTTVNGQTGTASYALALNGSYTSQDAGLQILPSEVDFGPLAVGTVSAARQLTLVNLTAKAVSVQFSMPRQFPLASTNVCPTLAAFGTCTFAVEYVPQSGAEATGTILATATPTDGSAMLQTLAYLQGYGEASGALTISGSFIPNAPLGFGQVTSGQTSQQTLTLSNSGQSTLNVRRVTSEPPFLSTTTCTAPLSPGQTCHVTVTYAPTNEVAVGSSAAPARADTGTLIIESDAAASPQVVDLAGSVVAVQTGTPGNAAVLAAYLLSNSALTFDHVAVGNSSTAQTITLTNIGTVTLHVFAAAASADFAATTTCNAVLPGATCTFTVTFTPSNTLSGTVRTSALEISSDAADALEFVTLLGFADAPAVTLAPSTLDFGTVNVGANGKLTATLTNNTGGAVSIASITATGDFSAAPGTCPAAGGTLAAGATCVLTVTFMPTAAGTRTGTLAVVTSATTLPLIASLTGNATQASLQVTPGALVFGSISVGATANLTVTLLNTGSAIVTGIATTITGANASDFAVTVPCSSVSLAPNQGCSITVSFTPTSVGARAATLLVTSSDPLSPASIPLTGTGVAAAGSFTLTVNGGASASATLKSGSPATYALLLTPVGGFTGGVALTCAPLHPATYATCSLSPSTLVLNGSAQASTVTINTITSAGNQRSSPLRGQGVATFVCWIWLPLLAFQRGFRRRGAPLRRLWLAPLVGILATVALSGCGGSKGGNNGYLFTPAGSYSYQVTATSTNGTQVTQTVTLNLTVQ